MARWEVSLKDEHWRFVPEDLSISSLGTIEEQTGVGLLEWLEQIDARRAHALQVLVWHLRGGGRGGLRKRDSQPIGSCQGDTPGMVDFRLGDFSIVQAAEEPLFLAADSDSDETVGSPDSLLSTG